MSSDYFVLQLNNVSSALEEWLSDEVFSHGALGISEVLPFSQPEGEETVYTQISDRRHLEIYFSQSPDVSLLNLLRDRAPEVEMRVRGEVSRDWLAEWKKGFKPFHLAGGHWVVPSWCEAPPESRHQIWIDPGMAFGTGTHETTQLVAEVLPDILLKPEGLSLLDVGTGTGILAILARQMGVNQIRATEIEADSRRVAHENFASNKCPDILLTDAQIEDFSDRFDVVVANIIDGVLVRVQEALKAKVKPGGWLIVSGIISERESDFVNGFRLPQGHAWMRRVQKGDWLLFATRL